MGVNADVNLNKAMKFAEKLKQNPEKVFRPLEKICDKINKELGLNLNFGDTIQRMDVDEAKLDKKYKKEIEEIKRLKNSGETTQLLEKSVSLISKAAADVYFSSIRDLAVQVMRKNKGKIDKKDMKKLNEILSKETKNKLTKNIRTQIMQHYIKPLSAYVDSKNIKENIKMENVDIDVSLLHEGIGGVLILLAVYFIAFAIGSFFYYLLMRIIVGKYREKYNFTYKGLLFIRQEDYKNIYKFIVDDKISLIRRIIAGLFTLSYVFSLLRALLNLVITAIG